LAADQTNEKDIEFVPPVTLKAGEIQFIEACHSPLTAGEYAVKVRQNISDSEGAPAWNSAPYVSEMVFSVDAPRFTLNPADIHSVYPPVNESGHFNNSLPHVVFTRRTLPWERTQDGVPPKFMQRFAPWIGLLLFQEEELRQLDPAGEPTGKNHEARPLPVFSEKEESLLSARRDNVLVPDVGQNGPGDGTDANRKMRAEQWRQEGWRYKATSKTGGSQAGSDVTSCLALDLPADLFKAVAPRDADLYYLAHVRQVDTGNKEVLGMNDRGWFSLVIGNRLPEAKKTHRAFLISLEGLQDYLKESWSPKPGQIVRVAVLGTWTFTCTESNDFKDLLDLVNLDREHPPDRARREQLPDSWLRLPYKPYDDRSGSPEDVVNGAYSRGYTAFDHLMRQGEKTVSWYRGPLVPLNYPRPKQIQEPVSGADELLRYDPETGLFDATYAAAWQLGRLLALQNQSFALALNRARKILRTKAEDLMRQSELSELQEKLNLPAAKSVEDGLLEYMANGAGQKLKGNF
jgi:hypothetical protein